MRQSSHYLPPKALPCCRGFCPVAVGSTLLLWALVCCRGLCPVAVGFALLSRSLPCWWSLSVMAGCLGNGRLCPQWECISVGAVCLGNGGCPFPTKLHCPGFSCAHSETLNPKRFESPFCLSLWGWDLLSLITWLPASEHSFCFF